MIKDKKYTIWFLVLSVALIWGTIIYKAIKRNPETRQVNELLIDQPQKSVREKYKYTLLLDYPDPFSRQDEVIVKKEYSAVSKKIKPTNWPNLKYNGRISTKVDVRAHFSFEKSSLIIKPGEIFADDCVVKTIYADSVLIVKAHEKKWYKK